MAVTPKKETADENSPVTISLIGSTASVTYHLGSRSYVDFVNGQATVHPDMAKRLRDLGHVE